MEAPQGPGVQVTYLAPESFPDPHDRMSWPVGSG